MLFGLSTDSLGTDFFSTNNNYFESDFCADWQSLDLSDVTDSAFDKNHDIYIIREDTVFKSSDMGDIWEVLPLNDSTVTTPLDLEYFEPEHLLFISGYGGVTAYNIFSKEHTEVLDWGWDPTRSVSCQKLPNDNIIMAIAISSWGSMSGVTIFEINKDTLEIVPPSYFTSESYSDYREIEGLDSPSWVLIDPDTTNLKFYGYGEREYYVGENFYQTWGYSTTKPITEWEPYQSVLPIECNWIEMTDDDWDRVEEIEQQKCEDI
jgi:hypothetical protein